MPNATVDEAQRAQIAEIDTPTQPTTSDVDLSSAGEPIAAQPDAGISTGNSAPSGAHEVETAVERLAGVQDDTGSREGHTPNGTAQESSAVLTTFPEFNMAEFLAFDATEGGQSSPIWWDSKTYDACRKVSTKLCI